MAQPTYPSWPSDLLENAVYSETIYVRQLDLANSLMSIDFKPEEWAFGKTAATNHAGQTISNDQKYWCELYTRLTVHGMLKRLQAMDRALIRLRFFVISQETPTHAQASVIPAWSTLAVILHHAKCSWGDICIR